MIQAKNTPATAASLPWPDNYYKEASGDVRLALLQEHMAMQTDEEAKKADAFRLRLHQKRYFDEKQGRNIAAIDGFMRAWMTMKVSGENGFGLFGRKRAIREWKGCMQALCIDLAPNATPTEKELLELEWEAFFSQLIYICVNDPSYGSLFGLVKGKPEAISARIAEELELLTETIPTQLGLGAEFADFHKCAAKAYRESTIV